MAISFVSAGSFSGGAGDITPGIPGSIQTDDLLLMFVETANEAFGAPAPDDWSTPTVTGTPSRGTAGAAGGVALQVFYRWVNGTETDPASVADAGDHQTAIILAYRGVDKTTPFDGVDGVGFNAAATTSPSFTGITTATANSWVVHGVAIDRDATSTTNCTSYSNANLSSVNERHDQSITAGQGGGVVICDGPKVAAGASGNTTATFAASFAYAGITLSLRPAPTSVSLTAPKISTASVLRAPSIWLQDAAPKLASASVLRSQTVALGALTATAPKLASGSTLRTPSVRVGLAAPKLATASVLRAPAVSLQVAVAAPKISTASVLKTHATQLQLSASKIASGSTLLAHVIQLGNIAVTAPKLASASTLRATSIQVTLTAPKLASASVLRNATVSETLSVTAPKIASGSVLRTHAVGEVIALTAPKLASGSTLWSPIVLSDVDTLLAPPKLSSASVLKAHSVTLGAFSVAAPKLASASALRSHAVSVETAPVIPETPATGTTGGGGGNASRLYLGKHRYDVRRTIAKAISDLSDTKAPKKKRKKIAAVLQAASDALKVEPAQEWRHSEADLGRIDTLQQAITSLAEAVRKGEQQLAQKRAERLDALFAQYQAHEDRFNKQQRDEEEALAIILALAL